MATTEDLPLPPPPALEDLPPPPPKESFSKYHQQRQASELRRLYRHIHPELRKNLAEAVADDLAEVLGSEEPTEGDVQCMRWIFENWRLDAIGDHDRPPAKELVPSGDVQATSRKFEEGSFANGGVDQEPAGPRLSGTDVRAARMLFETKPLDELTGQVEEAPEAAVRELPASGDVQGTRMLFEMRPLDRLGSRPSIQEQSPLELRSEIQELKGDVKKTVKLFQTEPLCAIQDAEGAIHEVKAACREEIHSNAVRTARWLFETQPLDAINRDPSQVRVIRGISLEEAARPDVSATRWIFETQPLDAIREIVVDEKDFQASPDLVPPGPDVQQQRHLFETRALDTIKGDDDEAGAEAPRKEEVVPGDVRSTLWLFETKPLDAPRDNIQVGHLQCVGPRGDEGLPSERLSPHGPSAMSPSQGASQRDGVKGDVKTFKNLFETLPLDSIGQGGNASGAEDAEQPQDVGSPVYTLQDGRGNLHALTSVSREQVLGGDVQGYRWMFETQPLDRLGRSLSTVDVVRGITRQEEVAGDVGTARWLFETQPLEIIHQRERRERQEEEGKAQEDPQPGGHPKGDVQTIRWLFETCPMSELAEKQRSDVTGPLGNTEAQSCTWMFTPQSLDQPEGSQEQHLQVNQVQTEERQTDGHVFETEPLQASGGPCGRGPVRYCSRVEIPSGQVSRQKEVFQALESGEREEQGSKGLPESIPAGSVRKCTWLFENCPMGSLAAESSREGGIQDEQSVVSTDSRLPKRQETETEGTLRTLFASPSIPRLSGILMETRGSGELCLAKYKYRLTGPGQGEPHIQKEELVDGELPRIVRQLLQQPNMAQQGLLVQEDQVGQLHVKPLRLPTPGSGGNMEDLDPEFQQLLACSLGTSVMRTGLVMQETEQGLVALTAFSLQPRLSSSRVPERSSVQLLANCINKGDLSGLHSLRWEPPADSSPATASEGPQRTPPTENIIRVLPLVPNMGVGHQGGPGACLAQPVRKPVPLTEEERQKNGGTGQFRTEAPGKSEGVRTVLPGSGTPDLQAAKQSLQVATAETQSLHQHILHKHKQSPAPGTSSMPSKNAVPQASATTTGAAHNKPVTGGDPKIPPAPRKVSEKQETLPRGLPGGWIQDGVYTARPVRTFDPTRGVQPSLTESPSSDKDSAPSGHVPGPLQKGPGQSVGPKQEKSGDCTQRAWGPSGKVKAGCDSGVPQAAGATLKAASSAHHALVSGPQAAGASLHSHNASVPPLSAAVTGPDSQSQACHDEDSMGQVSKPAQYPTLHSRNSPTGQRILQDPQTKTLKPESTRTPRKKPQLPPKPAHLSQIPLPEGLPKLLALSHRLPKETKKGEHKGAERSTTIPQPAENPAVGQDCVSLPRGNMRQRQPNPQHSTCTVTSMATKSQAVNSDVQSSEPHKLSTLSSGPISPLQDPSPSGVKPTEDSHPGAPENPERLHGKQRELLGLLNQVQALEKEASDSVDMGMMQRSSEVVPRLRGTPQAPASPCAPEGSVEQAFGELTRVSTEVARLKEQTLARLLDIEQAVHKALNSMSCLQPEAGPGDHSQEMPKDPSACKVRTVDSNEARAYYSGQEIKDQTAVICQTKATHSNVVQSQAKVRGHVEVKGQTTSPSPSTRRPETLREDSGISRVLPSSRDSSSSPTFISIESTTRKLPEMLSPKNNPDASHLTQNVDQKGAWGKNGEKAFSGCSGQPGPTPESASPRPSRRQKSVLELQTGPGRSKHLGATRTVTEQYEEVDEFGNTIMSSSSVTEQTELPRGPEVHFEFHTSPLLQQLLQRSLAEP